MIHSYLILSPAAPTDTGSASMSQRLSIPLAWAFAVASPRAELKSDGEHHYFQTRVADALAVLDRAIAGWSYNRYLRDTLAPISVFRSWLANYSGDTWLYLNISELIGRSPAPEEDLAQLRKLSDKVTIALEEIEGKNFTQFIDELRKLSYPLVTVPITGDRRYDMQILATEIRDTSTMEAEMALQMVGTDVERRVLDQAVSSIRLRKDDPAVPEAEDLAPDEEAEGTALSLYTTDLAGARELLVNRLGCSITRDATDHLILRSGDTEFLLVRVSDRDFVE